MRAPGVKQTLLPMQSDALKIGSMCTVPVKVSVGCLEGVEEEWAARMSCMLGEYARPWSRWPFGEVDNGDVGG